MLRAAGVGLWSTCARCRARAPTRNINFDTLGDELQPWQIEYGRIAELGGLRGRSTGVDPATNAFWHNQSFHNYADYALGDDFGRGLAGLIDQASERRTAIMCAEAVWWRCHRRIIADYLLLNGRQVFHLMGGARAEPAKMTRRQRSGTDGWSIPLPDPAC